MSTQHEKGRTTSQTESHPVFDFRRLLCYIGVLAWSELALSSARAQAPPQVVNVGLDFRFSGLAAADVAAVIAQTQALYTNAGFAPNAGAQRVNVFDVNAQGAPNAQIRVAVRNNAPMGQPLGVSFPANREATINLNIIDGEIGAGANQARRNMAYGEVTAHEVGHILSAVHQCAGMGAKRELIRDPMTGQQMPMVTQCMGNATLMSDGRCVPGANIGTNMLAFNAASTRQIGDGITDLVGNRNRNMQAPQRFGALELIEGQTNAQPVTFNGDTTYAFNNLVSFTYETSGRTDLFDIGWMNNVNQFIPALPEADDSDHTLESLGGAFLQFALIGKSGTPFDGQIFPQSDFGSISLTDFLNSPGEATTPGISEPYYSGATVHFDVMGSAFDLSLDTGMFGDHNGFVAAPVAEPASAALGLAALTATVLGRRATRCGLRRRRRGPPKRNLPIVAQ